MSKFILAVIGLTLPLFANAQTAPQATIHKHLGTSVQQQRARAWNHAHASELIGRAAPLWAVAKPFSEIEQTGYVAISGDDDFELPQLREAIAQNLPAGVTLVVYVDDQSQVAALQTDLGRYLSASQLKFLVIPVAADGDPLWARDSLPYPVHMVGGGFGLVDSIYPQDYNPDPQVQTALSLPMVNTNQEFRGGNLLLDMNDNCFAENANEVAALSNPQNFFTQYFGCATVTLLTQEGGIGDIDERLKFMTGTDVLTDNTAYQTLFQSKGYTVHMIPSTGNDMETYMNTLYINGTIIVPQMQIAADTDALAAYRNLGMTPVGVVTKQLADQGNGNIHCVTMNYPPGAFVASVRGGDFVNFALNK